MSWFKGTLVVSTFLILSCGGSTGIQETSVPHTQPPPPVPAPEKPSCFATHEKPFRCVAEACLSVSGSYNPSTHICKCPNPSHIFSTQTGGKCFAPEFESIFIDDQPASSIHSSHLQVPTIQSDSSTIHILSRTNNIAISQLMRNLFVTEIRLVNDPGSHGVSRHYLEPDSTRWSDLITRQPNQAALVLPHHPVIKEAWQHAKNTEPNAKQQVEFFTQDGCAGHCIIQTSYPNFKNHRLLEINEYMGGLSIRRQLLIEKLETPLYQYDHTVIEIDPTGSPNLIYIIKKNIEVYSREGELLATRPRGKPIEHLRKELAIRSRHQKTSQESVVVCDTGFLPSDVPRFRVGPRTDKSFWGWVTPASESETLSLWEQLSGVEYLSEINHGYFQSVDIRRHGASVAQLAIQSTNLSAISITVDQCFSHYEHWKKNVQPFARVINVSAFFYYDPLSCALESRFARSVGDPEQPFLWVFGAGNEYRHNLTASNSSYCPQSMGAKSNMLVVTAVSAAYANTGVDYADIAAEGLDFYENKPGTSFAAPRVARVAALLAEEFPTLSIAQIREAILQGAYVPTPRLPVRSGGILDEQGARRVAQKLYEAQLK